MSFKKATFGIALLLSTCLAPAAEAATWRISGTFEDLGTLSGFFDWGTNGFTNVTINTEPPATSPIFPYINTQTYDDDFPVDVSEDAQQYFSLNSNGLFYLTFYLSKACLSSATAPCHIPATRVVDSLELNFVTNQPQPVRPIASLTASPVPVPAALPLLATGLGALGVIGWRRKRKLAQAQA